MRQILHVATLPTFVGLSVDLFEEAAPGRSIVVTHGFDPDVAKLPAGVQSERIDDPEKLAATMSGVSLAVVHRMTVTVAPAVAATASTPVVWSGWGTDYYGTIASPRKGLLGPQSRSAVPPQAVTRRLYSALYGTLRMEPLLRQAARASAYFSAPVPDDLAVFRKRFSTFGGEYAQLNYATVEDTLAHGPQSIQGQDILVGNSATPENNHLEIFDWLAGQDLGDAKVVVPLNYGEQQYASRVIAAGRDRLGDAFSPMTDHLPLDEYNALMASCRTVIMGHWRQQALGNVLRALWQGAHLVLDRRNPISRYLDREGAVFHRLDEVRLADLVSMPIDEVSWEINREFLRRRWSRATAVENVAALLNRVG